MEGGEFQVGNGEVSQEVRGEVHEVIIEASPTPALWGNLHSASDFGVSLPQYPLILGAFSPHPKLSSPHSRLPYPPVS